MDNQPLYRCPKCGGDHLKVEALCTYTLRGSDDGWLEPDEGCFAYELVGAAIPTFCQVCHYEGDLSDFTIRESVDA